MLYKIRLVLLFICASFLNAAIDYPSEIQPIFDNYCINCHGNAGGLSLESYSHLMNGGNYGEVIVPGDYSTSTLYIRVTLPASSDEDMPPQGSLSQYDIDLIAQWIDEGALEEIDCDPSLACGSVETCCNGSLYPTTCCESNCDIPIDTCGDIISGDLNNDQVLNVLDVVLMVNLILNGNTEIYADMNQDSIINVLDVVILINIILA